MGIPGKSGKISEEIELKGHIIDSMILPRILDAIMDMEGDFEILRLDVGKTKTSESYARIHVEGVPELFDELERLGALLPKKEIATLPAPKDKVLPDGFYSTTNHPTSVYRNGEWRNVEELEMDCVIIIPDDDNCKENSNRAICKRQGLVKKGERIVTGLDGIKIEAPQRSRKPQDMFGFMSSDVSPEKPVNANAISPAIIKDMGKPLKGAGTSAISSFSRILAIITRARAKPSPEPSPNAMLSKKL